ncbi:McrC family protein [Halomonas sp. H33-56]|uniref:5-methylcytosine restriction system specificity protein McrC n=1 Tax=Halomonas sp. H33-56 TaxID=2950873 RepID=UPI0032DF7B6F
MIKTNTKKEIIELHEREARIFPRSALFDNLGKARVFSSIREMSAIEIRETLSGPELRVQGLIGLLPLTPELSLNLKTKFPISNLWHMLTIANSACDAFLPVTRQYSTSNSLAPHQVLIRSFCFYLKSINTQGIARDYVQEKHTGYYKPKINFGKTVKNYLSRGNDIEVFSDVFSFSPNLTANQYLKSACLEFLKIIPNSLNFEEERFLLLDSLNALDRIPSAPLPENYQISLSQIPSWIIDSYKNALKIYSIYLGHERIGFSYDPQGSSLPSFIFSLDTIFEDFVRNYLNKSFLSEKISVKDGNKHKNQKTLFTDNRRFPVKPDLIFQQKKNVLGVGEIKYKPKIDEKDRYQLISHVMALRAPLGVWISPAHGERTTIERIGSTTNGAEFYHCKISLSDDIEVSSEEMAKKIKKIILK